MENHKAYDNDRLPYGLSDFDPSIVNGYQDDPRLIDRSPKGGMASCLISEHGRLIPWLNGNYENGTEYHGDPPIQLRTSPTYIYQNPLDNVLQASDRALIQEIRSKKMKKYDVTRLGNENSEDMLSWNVFRSLQQVHNLKLALKAITGLIIDQEPDLFFWTVRIKDNVAKRWDRLFELRQELEYALSPQTEPDIVLHVPGEFWVFIEAKFRSENPGFKDDNHRDDWLKRNYPWSIIDREAVREAKHKQVPQQILRNIAFAHAMCEGQEKAMVVGLGQEMDPRSADIEERVAPFLAPHCPVTFKRATWEAIFRVLPAENANPVLRRLRGYMVNKTLNLMPAFPGLQKS